MEYFYFQLDGMPVLRWVALIPALRSLLPIYTPLVDRALSQYSTLKFANDVIQSCIHEMIFAFPWISLQFDQL